MSSKLRDRKFWDDYFDVFEDVRILEYDVMVEMSKYFTGFTVSPCDKYHGIAFATKSQRFDTLQDMIDIIKPLYENNNILMLYNVYSNEGNESLIIRYENLSTMRYIQY